MSPSIVRYPKSAYGPFRRTGRTQKTNVACLSGRRYGHCLMFDRLSARVCVREKRHVCKDGSFDLVCLCLFAAAHVVDGGATGAMKICSADACSFWFGLHSFLG